MNAASAHVVAERSPTGPYKFLDYYVESDKDKYAGRQRDIQEITARTAASRSLVLYGRSGLGKTSVLLAGVFPVLRERGFAPVYARTLDTPVDDVKAAFAKLRGDDEAIVANDDTLADYIGKCVGRKPVVLVLDQFEEFFIRFGGSREQRKEFIAAISEVANSPKLDVRVVFSLREDYLANLDEFREGFNELFANEYRLMPLTGFGARQAIVQPLVAGNIAYDAVVVSRVLDLLAEENFDPVVLQIVCTEVYRRAAARSPDAVRLEERDVKDLDDLGQIFERYIETSLGGMQPEQRLVVRAVLDALITLDRTKRAVTREHLENLDFTAESSEIGEVLEYLEGIRLVRSELRRGKNWLELSHDRIVDPLLRWIDSDRAFFSYKEARNLILNAARSVWREHPDLLLSQGQFEIIKPYEQRLRLNLEQTTMLVQSAIQSGSDRFKYWSGRLEKVAPGATLELLRSSLMPNGRFATRCGALLAIQQLDDPDETIVHDVLHVALQDPDADVRKGAGVTLRAVGRGRCIDEIRAVTRTRDKVRRQYARDLSAEIVRDPQYRTAFGFLDGWRARWQFRRNQRHKFRDKIDARRRVGTLSGFVAGLAWVSALAFLAVPFAAWERDLVSMISVVAGIALVLAPVLGWMYSSRAAAQACYGRPGSWFRAVAAAPILTLVMTLLFFWFTYLVFYLDTSSEWLLALVSSAAVAVALQLAFGLPVKIARAALVRSTSLVGIWLWSVAASYGVALLIPAAFYTGATFLARVIGFESELDAVVVTASVGLIAIPLCSFVVFVACASLATARHRAAFAPDAGGPGRIAGIVSRSVVALSLVVVGAWFLYFFGTGVVPLRPALALAESAEVTVPITFRPGFSEGRGSAFVRVKSASSWPVLLEPLPSDFLEVSAPDEDYLSSDRGPRLLGAPTTFLITSGESQWPNSSAGSLNLRTRPIETGAVDVAVSAARAYRRVTFERGDAANVWRASVMGTTKLEGEIGAVARIEMMPNQPSGVRGSIEIDRGDATGKEPAGVSSSGGTVNAEISEENWAVPLLFRPESRSAERVPQSFDMLLAVEARPRGETRQTARPLPMQPNTIDTARVAYGSGGGETRAFWWVWSSTVDGRVTFEVTSPGGYHSGGIQVLEGTDANPMAESYIGTTLSVDVSQNATYFVRVTYEYVDEVRLAWFPGKPVEPAFDAASVAPEPRTTVAFEAPRELSGDAGSSSVNSFELVHNEDAPIADAAAWWRLTAEFASVVRLSTDGSNFDTVLQAYTADGVLIGENDDVRDVSTSELALFAAAGQQVTIGVSGYEGASGNATLTWRLLPIADLASVFNDAFAQAFEVNTKFSDQVGILGGATVESGEPAHAGTVRNGSLWWRWEAPTDELIKFEVVARGFAPYVAVYRGESLASLEAVAAASGAAEGSAAAYFRPITAETYWIAIGAREGGDGAFILRRSKP